MKLFKRILAVLCWTLIAGGVINLFTNSAYGMFPMSLALIVLLFRWGKDLWVIDPDTALIKGWKKSLIFIGVHIGLVVVCGLIGVTLSVFLANGDSAVTNWIFLITIFFIGLWIYPNKFIPRHKTIPDNVDKIENYVYGDIRTLKIATIGNNVTQIGDAAFANCTNLISVYCKAATPPRGGEAMFTNNAVNRKIYVPRNSVEAYKSAEGWKEYADDIVGYDF